MPLTAKFLAGAAALPLLAPAAALAYDETFRLAVPPTENALSGHYVTLDAGTYTVTPIDGGDGFKGQSYWPSVTCTDPAGSESCQGYTNWFYVFSPLQKGFEAKDGHEATAALSNKLRYPTPEAALAAAEPFTFTMTATGVVLIFVFDKTVDDNSGGLMLQLKSQ